METVRNRRCPKCGRATKTRRNFTEWKILCVLAELAQERWQSARGLMVLCENGTTTQEFNQILRGLEARELLHVEKRWDGPRYYRELGAMVKFVMEGI
jgi:hypothetical protein